MLKLPKKEWLTRFAGTPLESISEWVRYYYISPVDYSYNDDGTIIKIDDVVGYVKLKDLNWNYENSTYRFLAQIYAAQLPASNFVPAKIYALNYKTTDLNTLYTTLDLDKAMCLSTGNYLSLRDRRASDVDELKALLGDELLAYIKADSPIG